MKKRCLSMLCALLILLTALSAGAEPIISGSGYTAWLGENNFLYLTDADGNTKVLQTPVSNLSGMTDTALYCTTADGRMFEIQLDGSSSRVVTEDFAPTAAYTLEDNVLILTSANGAGIPNVVAACTHGDTLYFVTADAIGIHTLKSVDLDLQPGMVPSAVSLTTPVAKPVTMTATDEAVVIVTEDHRAQIIALQPMDGVETIALDEKATHAFQFSGKLVSLFADENGRFTVLSAHEHPLVSPAALLTPVPTAQPTAVPTAKPTAKPTATPKPANDDDGRISKGDTGSAVRKMQKRLAELGYPVGAIDGDFGDNTLLAVNLFQCAIGYRNRSYASAKMLTRLYARNAPAYDPYAPLKEGDEGADVEIMQLALVNLGYSVGLKGVDGKFGPDTKLAVEQFQFIAGLQVTGEADVDTLKKLYDVEKPIPNATATPVPTATPAPTQAPTNAPTQTPTDAPTSEPTQAPTDAPTSEPTQAPTDAPTSEPTQAPTDAPTSEPTQAPTDAPTSEPTQAPTDAPTSEPTQAPTDEPSTTTDLT